MTSPVGLTASALRSLLTLSSHGRRDGRHPARRLLVGGAYALAALTVLAGLFLLLTQERQVSPQTSAPPAAQTISTGHIRQDVHNGSAVAAIQGNVTIRDLATSVPNTNP